MKIILSSFLIVAISLIIGCSEDGPGKGSITGKVHLVYEKTTETGERLGAGLKQDLFSGLSVSLQDIVKEIETATVESGVYSFTDVNAGEYNIVASITGDIRASTGFTELPEGGTTEFPLIKFSMTNSNLQSIILKAPYPNPSSDIITIEFNVTGNQFIDVKVYDLLGNEKEVLASKAFVPGMHAISYDCKLESGYYFVLVKSQDAFSYAIISKL